MRPAAALLAAIGWNYWEHKHHRPTICSTARRFLSPRNFLLGLTVLLGWGIPHYINGFPAVIDLDHLTD